MFIHSFFTISDELVEKSQQPIVYDHPEHTVTVESVGSVIVEHMDLLAAHGGIGENKVQKLYICRQENL